jgi:hypothetical protein
MPSLRLKRPWPTRCELRCFTTSIAPSSEASAKWIGEALIDRDVPAGSTIQIVGQMQEAGSYKWLEIEGAIITLSARKKQRA